LDLGGKKKKKKKPPPPPDEEKKPPEEEKKNPPSEGLDLSKPPPEEKKAGKEKDGTAPAMSFDAVDVSGKTADRQKIDAAIGQFKAEKYEDSALASYEIVGDPKMAGLAL